MKVIIVGAGIGGLSTYLALKKHLSDSDPKISITVTILESKLAPPTFQSGSIAGSAIAFPPNGLRALASFSPTALAHVQSHAFTKASNVTLRSSSGKTLGTMNFGSAERYGYGTSMLPRVVLHQGLLKEVDDMDIRWGAKVIAITEIETGEGGVLVECEDGDIERADLVIGADGVHSVVKDCVFNNKYQTEFGYALSLKRGISTYCIFRGQAGIGGFLMASSLPPTLRKALQTEGITMTFGRNGLFGYANASPLDLYTKSDPFVMWWSFYDPDEIPDEGNLPLKEIKAILLEKHGDWVSPHDEKQPADEKSRTQSQSVFRAIIESAFEPESPSDSIPTKPVVVPRFITPRLPVFSNAAYPETSSPLNRGRIVLIGDAAHTMTPDIGHGASCTIEDAVVYSLLLKHFISPHTDVFSIRDSSTAEKIDLLSSNRISKALEATAKAYESIRRPRVNSLTSSKKCNVPMKEMNSFYEWFRDMAIWMLCKFSCSPWLSIRNN